MLYVIHPGGLSPSCWSRIFAHLPAGTPVRVEELETITSYWADDPGLTVDALADRLRAGLRADRPRLLVGWGVGGVVADALAARMPQPPRRVVVLDSLAPGACGEPELERSFAAHAAALGRNPSPRAYEQHARRVRRDHRLTEGSTPSGLPLTVVKAHAGLAPESRALGWERHAPVEVLAAAGDHYSMLTDAAAAIQLALLLQRWLAPAYAAA
ncbi:MAG TPA: hypothetical protein VFG79_01560 [Solirubrobacter sp.]|nr:hypothetical protein [Solirubrobacter sp.]